MRQEDPSAEPLPIWFFVGVILLVYGLLITGSGLLNLHNPSRATVLADTRPALWWGLTMVVGGGIFTAIGLRRAETK